MTNDELREAIKELNPDEFRDLVKRGLRSNARATAAPTDRDHPVPPGPNLGAAFSRGWLTSEFAIIALNRLSGLIIFWLCLRYAGQVGPEGLASMVALAVPGLGEWASRHYAQSRTDLKVAQIELAEAMAKRE